MPCFGAFADDTSVSLSSISFNNAQLDFELSPDVYDYTITLDSSGTSPSLKSYEIIGDANLLITYTYDDASVQKAIVATLDYGTGSVVYTFTYSNPEVNELSSDNFLTDIYCTYGEISPAVNTDDTDYTLYIPSDLTRLTITPVTSDVNAVCSPVNLTLTEEQAPEITLVCTASDGSERKYNIKISRVDKTTEQVINEMSQSDYVSFVEETKFYEEPKFLFILTCAVAGAVIIILLAFIAYRINADPYDKDEKPFYKE